MRYTFPQSDQARILFDLRQRLEAEQYAGFTKELLDRLSRYKQTLIGPEIERKFVAYCKAREASLGEQGMQEQRRQTLQLELSTVRFGASCGQKKIRCKKTDGSPSEAAARTRA